MTTITALRARTARAINPTNQMYFDAVEFLGSNGWTCKPDGTRGYHFGWWVHPSHPVKNRPMGDSKDFYFGAWDTLVNYVLSDEGTPWTA